MVIWLEMGSLVAFSKMQNYWQYLTDSAMKAVMWLSQEVREEAFQVGEIFKSSESKTILMLDWAFSLNSLISMI